MTTHKQHICVKNTLLQSLAALKFVSFGAPVEFEASYCDERAVVAFSKSDSILLLCAAKPYLVIQDRP